MRADTSQAYSDHSRRSSSPYRVRNSSQTSEPSSVQVSFNFLVGNPKTDEIRHVNIACQHPPNRGPPEVSNVGNENL